MARILIQVAHLPRACVFDCVYVLWSPRHGVTASSFSQEGRLATEEGRLATDSPDDISLCTM